ncbi:MAG: DsbA family oxidoreductase [Acidimicrobiales bacterium]|nr:DsbA family oxidoreductase [Acidimicrobiales bacterium]
MSQIVSTATRSQPERLRIDVWSDVVCPWCYVGLTNLDVALAEFEHADKIDVVLHSYELDPGAPVRDDQPVSVHIAKKYGISIEQAEASQARIRNMGEEVDIEFNFDLTVRSNTIDAHRLLHLAAEHGLQRELKTELFEAYFTRGEVVGEHDTLRQAALAVGLPADVVDQVLDSDLYSDEVRADVSAAREMGISGVPFFLLDGDLGFGGAQPPDRMLQALQRVWAERRPEPAGLLDDLVSDADACGPDGCEVPGS